MEFMSLTADSQLGSIEWMLLSGMCVSKLMKLPGCEVCAGFRTAVWRARLVHNQDRPLDAYRTGLDVGSSTNVVRCDSIKFL